MELAIIVAAAENHVIGRDNGLIWHLSADLKRFKALTTGHAILMGRKTFESMGRALPNRRNVVISGNPGFVAPGAEDKWELIGREDHYADEKNEFDYSFLDYRLKAE